MMATKVPKLRMPLPHDKRSSGRISGMEPYFAGLKNVLCVLIKKMTAQRTSKFPVTRPIVPTAITPISIHFAPTIKFRLG